MKNTVPEAQAFDLDLENLLHPAQAFEHPRNVGVDWKQYRESTREDSVKAARADILLDEIAKREGVAVLDSEVDAELARIADRSGRSREQVRAQMQKEGDLGALAARIREEKTLDLLKSNASIELT